MIDNINGDIIIYQTDDGLTKVDVRVENETVWLSQQQMAELFDTTKQNISLHIKKIFEEEELYENSTVKEFLTVQKEGNRKVERKVKYYNLDMILSSTGEKVLIGAGNVSHDQAIKKAKSEYKKYQVKTISPVEEEYLKALKEINNKITEKDKK